MNYLKYCISARQPPSLLKKADEIKFQARDYQAIFEYIEKYPNKTYILEIDKEPQDWALLRAFSEKLEGKFYCAISDLTTQAEICRNRQLKFYYKYAVTSRYELDTLKKLGASYALIGIPLIFELADIADYGIPLRAIPNLAYEPYLKRENGLIGGWIRPEDTEKYGQYIDTFEFYAPNGLEQEEALYHIYAEKGTWPGNLNLLIENFGVDVDNRLIYDFESFAERRMNCRLRCLNAHNTCHYCEDQLVHFAKEVLPLANELT